MDEIIEMLEKTTRKTQKGFDEREHLSSERIRTYEKLLASKESTEAQKVQAYLGRMVEYDRLERLSSQLTLLYTLQIFAFKVNLLKISIDNINEQLNRSGILEKTKDIEEAKKKINKLMILLEAHYDSMKKLEEREENLAYVS